MKTDPRALDKFNSSNLHSDLGKETETSLFVNEEIEVQVGD